MNKQHVMILDDEPSTLRAIERVLRSEPIELCVIASPREALRLLTKDIWAVLLADYRMPEMDGIAVMEQARKLAPDTVRIMLTGAADIKTVIAAINRGAVYRVLEKPWDDDVLRITVRQAVELFVLIQEHKHAAEEARKAECNRVMLESLGAACHHLGQPATVLQTNLWLLQKQMAAATPEIRQLFDQCLAASSKLAELLRRLNAINEYRTTPYLPNREHDTNNRILDIGGYE